MSDVHPNGYIELFESVHNTIFRFFRRLFLPLFLHLLCWFSLFVIHSLTFITFLLKLRKISTAFLHFKLRVFFLVKIAERSFYKFEYGKTYDFCIKLLTVYLFWIAWTFSKSFLSSGVLLANWFPAKNAEWNSDLSENVSILKNEAINGRNSLILLLLKFV